MELPTKPLTTVMTLVMALLAAPALAQEALASDGGTQGGQDGPQDRTVYTREQERHWRVIEETVAGIAYCNRRDFLDPTYAVPILDWSARHLTLEGLPLIDQYARAVREAVARRRALNGETPGNECARFDGLEGTRTLDAFKRAVKHLDIAAS